MFEATIKSSLFISIVFIVAGALASLLVIAVRVADTSLVQILLTTRIGRTLLSLYPARWLAHWLHYPRLYDIAFAHMAHDQDYQKEAKALADAFARADWEAFQIGEQFQ